MVTLRNYFHNTTARVRAGKMSAATVRRIKRALCPARGCTCSGELGTRAGNQPGERWIEGGSIEQHSREAVAGRKA